MEFWLERGFDLAMSEKALNENESTYNESTYTDAEARQILETLFLIEDFFPLWSKVRAQDIARNA